MSAEVVSLPRIKARRRAEARPRYLPSRSPIVGGFPRALPAK
jgi:hypothetical protein